MGRLTADRPKCLLEVAGVPLLGHALARLRTSGCQRIVVITGYQASAIEHYVAGHPDVTCVRNPRASSTNVLHSLMTVRDELQRPALIMYSDVVVERSVFDQVLATSGDIVLAVDIDWRGYYVGRTGHPLGEADKAYVDERGRVVRIGKHLTDMAPPGVTDVGEFTGVLRVSVAGAQMLTSTFSELEACIPDDAPFQGANRWGNSYLTDLLQECIDRGAPIYAARVRRGWAELDTEEDYVRLESVAERQRLSLDIRSARPESSEHP